MKYFFTLVIFSTLIACEPSEEEAKEKLAKVEEAKEKFAKVNETQIAAATCSVLKRDKQMDSAFRWKKMNEARQKLDAPPFLDDDDVIKESIEWGTCELLVIDSDNYESVTLSVMSAYREKERMAKAKRVKKEQRAARRIADRQRSSS